MSVTYTAQCFVRPSLSTLRSPYEHLTPAESDRAFSLADVLASRSIHPFYSPHVLYPPNADAIRKARRRAARGDGEMDLKRQPLLWKKDLYTAIERLINDPSPRNTFRRSIYTSTTGGGSGSKPLFFATDVHENRRQRALFGRFLRHIGLATEKDWIVTVHSAGNLYRSLDLTLELLENAGATVLAAGHDMPPAAVVRLVTQYSANVLSGDSGQIVSMVRYISTLPPDERARFSINKIIYTSESLTAAQRAHIRAVLGPETQICSILGSAEGGPYAASSTHLSREHHRRRHHHHHQEDDVSSAGDFQDFIVDDRMTRIEILPTRVPENDASPVSACVPDGERGMIAQTSLTRLRNPLVRYITGDIGSLHRLPPQAAAALPARERHHMYVLRLYGRDRRFSFEWGGEYYEFRRLVPLMNDARLGILQWQVVLDKAEGSEEAWLEVRVLRAGGDGDGDGDGDGIVSEEELARRIGTFFSLCAANEERFRLVFLDCLDDFELSTGGRKVVKFIDRFN